MENEPLLNEIKWPVLEFHGIKGVPTKIGNLKTLKTARYIGINSLNSIEEVFVLNNQLNRY